MILYCPICNIELVPIYLKIKGFDDSYLDCLICNECLFTILFDSSVLTDVACEYQIC